MLKIAWRNLWRNSTRTLITAMAIALTYAVSLTAMGVQDYTFGEMRGAAAKVAGGDVIVQAAGYDDFPANDLTIRDAKALTENLEALPNIEVVSPRVVLNGLVSTSASSVPVGLQGIDPLTEAKLADMGRYLVEGDWLDKEADKPIVLGVGLAEELDAVLGDRIIVTAIDGEGEMARSLFYLTGLLKTGSETTDKALAFTTIAEAQRAAKLGDGVHQIGLVGGERHELQTDTQAAVQGTDVEVLTWDEAMPELIGFIEMKQGGGKFMSVLLFLVVLFAILNTFLMIVMERIREFGLLGALGMTPTRTMGVLAAETAFLALVAMAMGLGLGLGLHFIIDTVGIDFGAMYGDSMDVAGVSMTDTVIRSKVDVGRWISSSISVFLMVMTAAIYPAIKAWRLEPADAMRFYE